MRKKIITEGSTQSSDAEPRWLELERLAQVEVTSEEAAHPVESALIPGGGMGWRASQSGEQRIRLLFDEPQRIERIRLQFREETGSERTQEFTLRWSTGGQPYREILRQQYNFSPPEVTSEVEDYTVALDEVKELELIIIPNISGGYACATLEQLRLA